MHLKSDSRLVPLGTELLGKEGMFDECHVRGEVYGLVQHQVGLHSTMIESVNDYQASLVDGQGGIPSWSSQTSKFDSHVPVICRLNSSKSSV